LIRIFPASEAPKIVRKYASSDEEVFLQARDFFHRNKDIRHHKVVVYDHEKPVFCLGFMKNNPTNVDKNHPQVQMQLSNFWEYSPDDGGAGLFLCRSV